MQKQGIVTASDFVAKENLWVISNYSKPYHDIWLELHGKTVMKLNPETKVDYVSIQKTETFHPTTNSKEFLLTELSVHTEDACNKARYYRLAPKKISFFLKSQKLEYFHCSFSLSIPTNTPEIIIKLVEEKFNEIYRAGVMYRATGITLQNLSHNNTKQMDLFGETNKVDKLESIYKELDKLEEKFGKRVVHLASTKKLNQSKDVGGDEDFDRHLLFM
jgi:nucleotidyltransferase/DNA polymerase involved in DNA repair